MAGAAVRVPLSVICLALTHEGAPVQRGLPGGGRVPEPSRPSGPGPRPARTRCPALIVFSVLGWTNPLFTPVFGDD